MLTTLLPIKHIINCNKLIIRLLLKNWQQYQHLNQGRSLTHDPI